MENSNSSTVSRLFLDSGVVLEGLFSPWSASRGVLILCRHRGCKIVLAEYVRSEVEENLLALFSSDSRLANEIVDTYDRLLRLLKPETVPQPTEEQINQHRHLIHHQADVPVLVSALLARPHWFLTTNTRHFTKHVAERTQLKIVTPQTFLANIRP
jgi:predicted nucleic acid-binding protein